MLLVEAHTLTYELLAKPKTGLSLKCILKSMFEGFIFQGVGVYGQKTRTPHPVKNVAVLLCSGRVLCARASVVPSGSGMWRW